MRKITVKDFVKITNGKLICGNEEEILENFKKDTKEIEERRHIRRNKRRKTRRKPVLRRSLPKRRKSLHTKRNRSPRRKNKRIQRKSHN